MTNFGIEAEDNALEVGGRVVKLVTLNTFAYGVSSGDFKVNQADADYNAPNPELFTSSLENKKNHRLIFCD